MTSEPLRLCWVRKRSDFEGFGFTLQAERGAEGQYIGEVDKDSPAERAGLRRGDRIVEVNGVSVLREEHQQVVARIRGIDFETCLFVAEPVAFEVLQNKGTPVTSALPEVVKHFSEPEATFEYMAKLCHLRTWPDGQGYGFNLHFHKSLRKHVIGKVDDDSPARFGGLVEGDMLIEVNDVNVEKLSHTEVVERVTEKSGCVDILLIGPHEENWFRQKGIGVGNWMSQLRELHCPAHNPNTKERDGERREEVKRGEEEEEKAVAALENSLSPRLRLVRLRSWGSGYGFNMQSEKKKPGQYISNVDKNSPAEHGGMKEGDLILAVNGTSVEGLKHQEVVSIIRSDSKQVRLLLADPEAKKHFEEASMPLYDAGKMATHTDEINAPECRPDETQSTTVNGVSLLSENKENVKNKSTQPEVLLDVKTIQPSKEFVAGVKIQADTRGSGEVPINTKHVPSPATNVGSVAFSGSAQEARQRLAKKKQASQQMSVQKRHEIFESL